MLAVRLEPEQCLAAVRTGHCETNSALVVTIHFELLCLKPQVLEDASLLGALSGAYLCADGLQDRLPRTQYCKTDLEITVLIQ